MNAVCLCNTPIIQLELGQEFAILKSLGLLLNKL